jgi:pyruvate dehydrogenase E2 component (dihydrolipoamide acetyltransferase)
MPIEITIPRLGWSMDEGTFGEWSRKDGDHVASGDAIFLLETEKALQEVESVDDGILHILANAPKEGDTVKVGTVIGYLLSEGEEPPEIEEGSQQSAVDSPAVVTADCRLATDDSAPAASPSVRRLARDLNIPLTSLKLNGTISEHDVRRAAQQETIGQRSVPSGQRTENVAARNSDPSLPKVSPRAARVARRFNIDWTTLNGSGRNGRIREQDVLAAAGRDNLPDGVVIPATPTRKLIAERMAQSARTTVPVTLTTIAHVDGILRDRTAHKQQTDSENQTPAIHDYVILSVAKALQKFPALNSRWMNGEILQPDSIHIGLAVDTQNGLIVPVVRNADQKPLPELAEASAALVARARDRRLSNKECMGGTFTVSNLGAFGIDAFTPVINLGESAILGIGAIRRTPDLSDDGSITWSQQMTLSLTFDHQVVDGAPAARFLQHVVDELRDFT